MAKYRNLIIVGILLSVAFVMRFHAAKSIFFVEDAD